jgi:hypothetical protein
MKFLIFLFVLSLSHSASLKYKNQFPNIFFRADSYKLNGGEVQQHIHKIKFTNSGIQYGFQKSREQNLVPKSGLWTPLKSGKEGDFIIQHIKYDYIIRIDIHLVMEDDNSWMFNIKLYNTSQGDFIESLNVISLEIGTLGDLIKELGSKDIGVKVTGAIIKDIDSTYFEKAELVEKLTDGINAQSSEEPHELKVDRNLEHWLSQLDLQKTFIGTLDSVPYIINIAQDRIYFAGNPLKLVTLTKNSKKIRQFRFLNILLSIKRETEAKL